MPSWKMIFLWYKFYGTSDKTVCDATSFINKKEGRFECFEPYKRQSASRNPEKSASMCDHLSFEIFMKNSLISTCIDNITLLLRLGRVVAVAQNSELEDKLLTSLGGWKAAINSRENKQMLPVFPHAVRQTLTSGTAGLWMSF